MDAAARAVNAARAALALKEAQVEAAVIEMRNLSRSVAKIKETSDAKIGAMAEEVREHRTAAEGAKVGWLAG